MSAAWFHLALRAAPWIVLVTILAYTHGVAYFKGQSAARVDAAIAQADALAATLRAQHEAADHIEKARIVLAKKDAEINARQKEIRRLIREGVEREKLGDWYGGNINSVERVALYGVPRETVPGDSGAELGSVIDTTDPATNARGGSATRDVP